MHIWFKEGVNLTKFCTQDSYRIAEGMIKPAGVRDVEVLIKGLNWNKPDGTVIQYISHFAKVVRPEVAYVKKKTGLKNGDRKYLVNFSDGSANMQSCTD